MSSGIADVRRRLAVEMVVPSLPPAGMETVVVELALLLQAMGHDIGFTCIHGVGSLAERLRDSGMRVSHVPLHGKRGNLLARPMAPHLARLAPDVVHSHSGAWHQSVLPSIRRGGHARVHTAHGLPEDGERLRDRLLARLAASRTDAIVAVSDPLAAYLRVRIGAAANRLVTVYNGVDTTRFTPDRPGGELRLRLELPADARLLGIVARLSPVKDHATLIRAFARAAPANPRWHLVLIGDGPLRDAVVAQVEKLGLAGRVHLVGVVKDVAPLYRDLDLFVLSSVSEGTSISLLEAMASGVPVVATAVGGNPDVVGDAGLLVPPDEPGALADALGGLMATPEERGRRSAAGRERVEDRFSLRAMAESYARIYRSLFKAPAESLDQRRSR